MPKGGSREGAGRPKGALNQKTRAIAEKAIAEGVTPLEHMLGVMRDYKQPDTVRLDAAKSAAPYVHPRLAAVEHTGKDGGPIMTADASDSERAKALAAFLARTKKG